MLSILIPLLNEEESILPLYLRLKEIADAIKPCPAEFIFIDDGSTDGSLGLLKQLALNDPALKIISFTRNFGSHAALRAGLSQARGDAAVNISADLQEPSGLIIAMFRKWQGGAKLVLGVRTNRSDPFLRKACSYLAHKFIRRLVSIRFPASVFDICLLDRSIIDQVMLLENKNVSFFNLALSLESSYETVGYLRGKRLHGATKWTFGKLVRLFIDSVIPFTKFSARLLFYAGVLCIQALFLWKGKVTLKPFSAIIALCGLETILFGAVIEYLMRTFVLPRRRVGYSIKERIHLDE